MEMTKFETFKKRSGTTNFGKDYEENFIAALILDLIQNENVRDFQISSNDSEFGDFDDVVLRIVWHDDSEEYYAFQLKASERDLRLECFESSGGDFSFIKYYASSKKINTKSTLIIFTNRTFKRDRSKIILHNENTTNLDICESCIPKEFSSFFDQSHCFSFKCEDNNEMKVFCDSFLIFTNQLDSDGLEKFIWIKLQKLFLCDNRNVCKDYLQCINKWSQDTKKKLKLTKILMRNAVALCLLTPFIKHIPSCEVIDPEINAKIKLIVEAVSKYNLTYLESAICEVLNMVISEIRKMFKKTNYNNLFTVNMHAKFYQVTSTRITDVNLLSDEECTILAWLMNFGPLIILGNKNTFEAIKLCRDKHFFIVFDNILTENNSTNVPTFKTLADLEIYSKIYNGILETFRYCLQGKSQANLKTLIRENDKIKQCITSSFIFQMLQHPLKIGEESENIPMPYITRFLTKHIVDYKFLERVSSDAIIIIISNIEDAKNSLNSINRRIRTIEMSGSSILKAPQSSKHGTRKTNEITIYVWQNKCFEEIICNISDLCSNIHIFRVDDNGNLEWLRSRGETKEVIQFIIEDVYIEDMKLLKYAKYNNVGLITAEPGLGKTVLFKNLKNNSSLKYWTLFIEAKNFSKYFGRTPNDTEQFLENYLQQHYKHIYNCFDLEVFKCFKDKKSILFLWDGLDEALPEHVKIITDIIHQFSAQGFRHFISSRGNLATYLENEFGIMGRTIRQFDEEEQLQYIQEKKKNMSNLNENDFNKNINRIITLLRPTNILAIPLQIFMFTNMLFQKIETSENRLSFEYLSVADLYEYFVEEQFQFYFIKEKCDPKNAVTIKRNENFKFDRLENFGRVAVKMYFPEHFWKHCEKINYNNFLDKIKNEGKDVVGFITEVSESGMYTFLHKSFGEYFAALYMVNHFNPILKEIIFKNEFKNIRLFMDLILAKGCPAHIAVLHRNFDLLTQCTAPELECKDQKGRNPLQLACSWGKRYDRLNVTVKKTWFFQNIYIIDDRSLNVIEEKDPVYHKIIDFLSEKNNPEETDDAFNFDSFLYADKAQCLLPLVLSQKYNIPVTKFENFSVAEILYYAAMFDYSFLFDALGTPFVTSKQTQETIFRIAVKHGSTKVVIKLLASKNYEKDIKIAVLENNFLETIAQDGYQEIVEILWEERKKRGEKLSPIICHNLLIIACEKGLTSLVKKLIQKGVDVTLKNEYGETPLYLACERGHYEISKLLIEFDESQANVPNKAGETPLHRASLNGHKQVVEMLFHYVSDVNISDQQRRAPLHAASKNGNYEICKMLLRNGADVNARDNYLELPLHCACTNGHSSVVKLLIKHKSKINAKSKRENLMYPIQIAFINKYPEIVKILISAGAQIDITDKKRRSLLHYACINGYYEIVELLIDKNADVNATDKYGESPLHYAFEKENVELIMLLITRGADPRLAETDNGNLMHKACAKGYYDVVRLLIDAGVDVNIPNQNGELPIHTAYHCAKSYYNDIISSAKAGKINDLHISRAKGRYQIQFEIVELLTNHGAILDAMDKNGAPLIYQTCVTGDVKFTKLLIDKNCQVNVTTKTDETPLHAASGIGNIDIVKLLLQKGANVNAEFNNRGMPIHRAFAKKHYDIVELLLQSKAVVHTAGGHYQRTPLHYACQAGKYDLVQKIISNPLVNVNATDNSEITPLLYASFHGYLDIVKLLIDKNADVNLSDSDGVTLLGVAFQMEHFEICTLLSSNGAKSFHKPSRSNPEYEWYAYSQ